MTDKKRKALQLIIIGFVVYLISRLGFFGGAAFELGGIILIIMGIIGLFKKPKSS